MTEGMLIALISAGLPTIATIITGLVQARANSRHSAKQSIFQMILEDHIAVQEGHLPDTVNAIPVVATSYGRFVTTDVPKLSRRAQGLFPTARLPVERSRTVKVAVSPHL